ncbi:MAG: magnesium transporter CorA family protein [Ruminococcaceae bacterium]|nr:magnesium transporter CorA family protein [Oscillospiraceae bacterium]
MINYYRTVEGVLRPTDCVEKNCWVSLIDPDEKEIAYIAQELNLEQDFLRAALDEEETSHIDVEDDQVLVIVDIPVATEVDGAIIYSTLPLGIIFAPDNIVTVCLKENSILSEFTTPRRMGVNTAMRARFMFQILYKVSVRYLQYLKQIDKISKDVEKQLHRSMKNQELIQLLDLEKSLVYFSTSLKANESTIKKLARGRIIKLYEEDEDLLEDVLIEVGQAIEMCNIYSSILSGTMDAFASIISNNLNIVMKLLASLTIVMSVPTMIASFYGMNVAGIPFAASPYAFWIVVLITLIATGIAIGILVRNKMF